MKRTQSYFVYPRKVCVNFQLKKLKIAEVHEVIFLRPQVTYPENTRSAPYTILHSHSLSIKSINESHHYDMLDSIANVVRDSFFSNSISPLDISHSRNWILPS